VLYLLVEDQILLELVLDYYTHNYEVQALDGLARNYEVQARD